MKTMTQVWSSSPLRTHENCSSNSAWTPVTLKKSPKMERLLEFFGMIYKWNKIMMVNDNTRTLNGHHRAMKWFNNAWWRTIPCKRSKNVCIQEVTPDTVYYTKHQLNSSTVLAMNRIWTSPGESLCCSRRKLDYKLQVLEKIMSLLQPSRTSGLARWRSYHVVLAFYLRTCRCCHNCFVVQVKV